jgi:hypothetical protein
MVEIVKYELSVSRAEEVLHFSSRYRDEVAQLLNVAPETVDRFAEAAASAIDDHEVASILARPKSDYSYPTGHDGEERYASYACRTCADSPR